MDFHGSFKSVVRSRATFANQHSLRQIQGALTLEALYLPNFWSLLAWISFFYHIATWLLSETYLQKRFYCPLAKRVWAAKGESQDVCILLSSCDTALNGAIKIPSYLASASPFDSALEHAFWLWVSRDAGYMSPGIIKNLVDKNGLFCAHLNLKLLHSARRW